MLFTENGVAMLSTVLNSESAIQVNIAIMRTFTKLRSSLSKENLMEKGESRGLAPAALLVAPPSLDQGHVSIEPQRVLEFDHIRAV